eukprot:s7389_g2.t1
MDRAIFVWMGILSPGAANSLHFGSTPWAPARWPFGSRNAECACSRTVGVPERLPDYQKAAVCASDGLLLHAGQHHELHGHGRHIKNNRITCIDGREAVLEIVAVYSLHDNGCTSKCGYSAAAEASVATVAAGLLRPHRSAGLPRSNRAVFLGKVHPTSASLLSWAFLGERLSSIRGISIGVSILGVGLIAKPSWEGLVSGTLLGPTLALLACSPVSGLGQGFDAMQDAFQVRELVPVARQVRLTAALDPSGAARRARCGLCWLFLWSRFPSAARMHGLASRKAASRQFGSGCWRSESAPSLARSFWPGA